MAHDDYCWNCLHVHDIILHHEIIEGVLFYGLLHFGINQADFILFLKDPFSSHLRKLRRWKWGRCPRVQSLQESFPWRPQRWPWRTWRWWWRGKKIWAENCSDKHNSRRHKVKQKAFAELPALLSNKILTHTLVRVCVFKQIRIWTFIELIPLNFSLGFAWRLQAFSQTSSFYKPQVFVSSRVSFHFHIVSLFLRLFHFHIAPREGQPFPKSVSFPSSKLQRSI